MAAETIWPKAAINATHTGIHLDLNIRRWPSFEVISLTLVRAAEKPISSDS